MIKHNVAINWVSHIRLEWFLSILSLTGYSREAQKAVQQYRSTLRFEQSRETEAVVNAKYQ